MSLTLERFSAREWSWLALGSVAAVVFIFAVPPTPFDALDFRSILLPYLVYAHDSFRALEFPFWNPYSSLGRPFAADPQAIVCWPLSVVYFLVGPFWGILLLACAHTLFAVWSSAQFCRWLGAARVPALLSGFAFVLSGKLTGHYQAGHIQFVFLYLYLPALLLCAVYLQEAASTRRAVGWLALVSGVHLLAGGPQIYWNCALAVSLFLVGRRACGPLAVAFHGIVRDAIRTAMGYALGCGLAAVLLVPLVELIKESNRAGIRPEFTAIGSMSWPHWLTAFSPFTRLPEIIDWEMLLYPGVLITVLGLTGIARLGDRNVRGLVAVLAGTALIAAGNNTPLFDALCRGLPGFASFRVHGRIGAVIVYALIVSGVLLVSDPRRQRWAWPALAIGAIGMLVIALLPDSLITGTWPTSAWAVRPLVIIAITTFVGWAWLRSASSQAQRGWGLLAVGVLAVDLIATDLWLKRDYITSQNYAAETELVAALRETDHMRPGVPPPRVFAPPRLVRANAGMVYGFATFAGSEALALKRVWNYVHWAVGREPPTFSDIYLFEAFAERGMFPVPWVAQVASIEEKTLKIEVRRDQPPRVWLNGEVRVVADWREAAGRLAAGHDAFKSALIERPLDPGTEPEVAGSAGHARITNFRSNAVTIEVAAPARALLVLAEAWYPGWRARVDGREQPVVPANGWMRAVSIPAGAKQVEFFYRPSRFFVGLAGSLATACLLVWMLRRDRAADSGVP